MGTRQSIDHFLEQCNGALRFADFEYTEASRQEHWDDENYQNAQAYLEEAVRQMEPIYASANAEQKELLQRMKTQIDSMRHDMITLRH